MSELEKKLREKAGKGEWAEFLPDTVPDPGQADVTIQASFIRGLLLGLEDSGGQRVQGVRLRGAVIDGVLDLSDCAGADGEPLPPLLFHRCLLLGDPSQPDLPVLNGLHARLSRLSLKECRIGRVDLSDATLGGDLEIDEVQPLNEERSCQISAQQCRIDGWVIAKAARLRIPYGQKTTDFNYPDYALHLADSEINGSIALQPEFHAEGGVNLKGARVSGDIWAEGAEITASELTAFRAQSLQCDGIVALRGTKESQPCKMSGTVDFLAASVDFLDLRGIHIAEPPRNEAAAPVPALTLALMRVQRNLWLQKVTEELGTKIAGFISAQAADIGGDLSLTDMEVYLPASSAGVAALQATNLRVGGNLHVTELPTDIILNGSHVEHSLIASRTGRTPDGKDFTLAARNIEIGKDCILDKVSGIVDLELARIGGALLVQGEKLVALNAKDAEVRGSVRLRGTVKQKGKEPSLLFDGGNYLSEFKIQDMEFLQVGEVVPLLSIEDARIERDLCIEEISVTTALLTDPRAIRFKAARPLFYPGWTLVEALYPLSEERVGTVAFLQKPGEKPVLLPGLSPPIHEMNRRCPIVLETDEAAKDYLRFFCAYVWGDGKGSFTIVESPEALGGALEPPDNPPQPIEILRSDQEKGWELQAFVQYGEHLFRAIFQVSPNGMIAMTEDEPLAEIKEAEPDIFMPPVRIIASPDGVKPGAEPAAFMLPLIFGDRLVDPPHDATATFDQLQKQFVAASDRPRISLCGLKAGALNHDPDNSWGPGIVLKLEGFEYDRWETQALRPRSASREVFSNPSTLPWPKRWLASLRSRLSRDAKQFAPGKGKRSKGGHLEWLSRQYTGGKPSSKEEYTPQPYEQLARVLRDSGHSDEAKRIILEKLSLERKHVHPGWSKPAYWLMETCFQYGLFARRSVVWFLFLWLGGAALFDLAYHGRIHLPSWPELNPSVMVVDTLPVHLAGPLAPTQDVTAAESLCVGEIDSLWYALDVFVPLLDLHQEERCTISSSDGNWLWRSFKSLYAVAGGIVTSMMLLSISGVLRRRVEQ